jgi:hypothetical protein
MGQYSQYDTQISDKPLNLFEIDGFCAGTQIDKVMQKLEFVIDEKRK